MHAKSAIRSSRSKIGRKLALLRFQENDMVQRGDAAIRKLLHRQTVTCTRGTGTREERQRERASLESARASAMLFSADARAHEHIKAGDAPRC